MSGKGRESGLFSTKRLLVIHTRNRARFLENMARLLMLILIFACMQINTISGDDYEYTKPTDAKATGIKQGKE